MSQFSRDDGMPYKTEVQTTHKSIEIIRCHSVVH